MGSCFSTGVRYRLFGRVEFFDGSLALGSGGWRVIGFFLSVVGGRVRFRWRRWVSYFLGGGG